MVPVLVLVLAGGREIVEQVPAAVLSLNRSRVRSRPATIHATSGMRG
jgi:hypothetical protein